MSAQRVVRVSFSIAIARAGAPSAPGSLSGRQQNQTRGSTSAAVFERYSTRITPFRSRTSWVTFSASGRLSPFSSSRIG
jgi:hypothetical protein